MSNKIRRNFSLTPNFSWVSRGLADGRNRFNGFARFDLAKLLKQLVNPGRPGHPTEVGC
jgi:hypothetical protein